MKKFLAAGFLALTLGLPAHAIDVSFGSNGFLDAFEFLAKARDSHPNYRELARAIDAVVLIGGRASGVIISPDGHMITARHTLDDLSFTADDCARIPLFLFHDRSSDGVTMDERLTRVTCDKILVNEYADDFILLKLKPAPGAPYPYADIETDEAAIAPGDHALAVGHPHALTYSKGVKKVSSGQIVLYEPQNAELPHFLHRIDTEGGSSGGAILNARTAKLVGLHFRGVRSYGPGVKVLLDGKEQVIHSFNVALPVPYLSKKSQLPHRSP